MSFRLVKKENILKKQRRGKMKLELSKEELQLVLNSLGELPAKISFDLIIKIQAQANEQLNKEE